MSGSRLPRVTAVVLNWCGENVTRRCLRSLERSTYGPLRVLLVDNGSPDGSGDRLHAEFPDLPYLQNGANLGYAGGNNRGIEWALGAGAEQVLVLNNDTVVEPEAVGHLVRALLSAGDQVAAVGPKILRLDDPTRIWWAGGDFSRLRGLGLHRRENALDTPGAPAEPEEVTFLTGCCFLTTAPVLRRVGGFAEDFFAYIEDVEWSLRLVRAGFRLLYEPRARILHEVPPWGAPPTPFQIRQRDRNRRRLMRRHFSASQRLPFLVRFYATRSLILARYLARGDMARAGAILAGAVGDGH